MKRLVLVLVVMAVLFLVAGNLFAWEDGVQYEITQVATGGGSNNPDINNNGEIVWWDNAVMSNYRGMVSPYGAIYPSISNAGEIVWLQSVSRISNWQVFSNTRGQLTFGNPLELNLGSPKVNSSGEVVYTATDGLHYQVHSTVRGQITFNDVDHSYAAINDNGEIIWTEAKNGNDQVVSNLRGQLTFDPANKFSLDLNNQGEFSYGSSYEGSLPHVFSSRNGVIIADAEQYQWYSGINDHGDIVFTSNVNAGQMEIFVAHLLKSPILKVKANNSESAITITDRDRLNVSISVDPADYAGKNMDWWLMMKAPNGYFSMAKGGWRRNVHVYKGAPMATMTDKAVAVIPRPMIGKYTLYFCVDTIMDGMLDLDAGRMFCDSAEVEVVRHETRKPIVFSKIPVDENIKKPAGAKVTGACFYPSATADVALDEVYIMITPALGSSLSELSMVSLFLNTVQTETTIITPKLVNRFALSPSYIVPRLNHILRKGETEAICVQFNIKNGTPEGHNWSTKLYLTGRNLANGQRFTTPIVKGYTVTVVKGEIKALPPSAPASRQLVYGRQNELIMENNFDASYDGYIIKRLKLSLPNWQAGCATTGISVKYKNSSGLEMSQSTFFRFSESEKTAEATLTGLTAFTPPNGFSTLKYNIGFLDYELSCGFTGVEIKLTLEEFEATSIFTGEQVVVRPRISSNPMYLYKSVPYIKTAPIQQPLVGGIQLLNKTIVGTNSAGNIDWNELSYEVEKSAEVAFANAWLVDSSTGEMIEGTTTVVDLNLGSAIGSITFLPAVPQIIMAGGQKEYLLFATISGVTSSSYVSTWIGQPSIYSPSAPYADVATTNTSFIWSDKSEKARWNNSYLISGLPTVKQTLTR